MNNRCPGKLCRGHPRSFTFYPEIWKIQRIYRGMIKLKLRTDIKTRPPIFMIKYHLYDHCLFLRIDLHLYGFIYTTTWLCLQSLNMKYCVCNSWKLDASQFQIAFQFFLSTIKKFQLNANGERKNGEKKNGTSSLSAKQ